MAFVDLTAEEQQDLQSAVLWMRDWFRRLASQNLDLKMSYWTQVISPILAQLLDADEVPNVSSLPGAQDLTKAELNTLQTWISGISADIQTNKALLVKAIGVNAD